VNAQLHTELWTSWTSLLQALETMCKDKLIADVVAVIGSIDIVLGAIDR